MEAVSDPDRCLYEVTLTGGPHDGRVAGEDYVYPGLTIVMPRIPEDGPMVHDLYLVVAGADGKLLGNFMRTEPVPEPPEAEDGLAYPPALDPVIVATANTFRYLAEWFGTEEQRAELHKMAEAVEAATPECDYSCPVCEETTCDEGCPLAPVRNRWYADGMRTHAKEPT